MLIQETNQTNSSSSQEGSTTVAVITEGDSNPGDAGLGF